MPYLAPSGATLTLASNATSGTVAGDVSAYNITAGMALAPGIRGGVGPLGTRTITSWTVTTSPVGATFTINEAFKDAAGNPVAFAAGTPFTVDNFAVAGSVSAQNALSLAMLLDAQRKAFGLSLSVDQASKTFPRDRGAGAGTYSRDLWQLSGRTWFGLEHVTDSAAERLILRSYPNGVTAVDAIDIDGSTGTMDFLSAETTLPSAATVNLASVRTRRVAISGATTITSFGSGAYKERLVRFTGPAPVGIILTHNATSLVIPGGANLTLQVGDAIYATSDLSGNWRIIGGVRASGAPMFAVGATSTAAGLLTAADKIRLDGLQGGDNLVPDGSFERGLAAWTTAGLTTATASIPAGTNGYDGVNYALINVNGQATGSPSLVSGMFPVVPGGKYVLSGAVLGNVASANGSTVTLRVYWYKGDGSAAATTQNSLNAALTTSWAFQQSQFTAPADATQAQIRCIVNAANTSATHHYFDAVSLRALVGANDIDPAAVLTLGGLTLASTGFTLAPKTFGTLPTASGATGQSYRVTDRNHRMAISDGTNWRWGDNAIAS